MIKLILKQAFLNIFRNRYRSIAILSTISVSMIVLILLGGFYEYLFNSLHRQIIAESGHLYLTSAATEKDKGAWISRYPDVEKILQADSNVALYTPRIVLSGIIGYEDKSAIFSGFAVVPERELAMRAMALKGSWEEKDVGAAENGAVLGAVLARNLNAAKGTMVNCLTTAGGMRGFSFPVVDIVVKESEDRDRVFLQVPIEGIRGLDGKATSIQVMLKDTGSIDETIQRLADKVHKDNLPVTIHSVQDSGSYYSKVINIYMSNYYFVLAVIALTVFFAISNNIVMSVSERVRELGTMRAFGMTKPRLTALFIVEGAMLGLIGFLAGCVLSLGIMFIINLSGGIYIPPPPTQDKGFYSMIDLSLSALTAALSLSVLVSLAASFLSTLRANAMTITEELRHV